VQFGLSGSADIRAYRVWGRPYSKIATVNKQLKIILASIVAQPPKQPGKLCQATSLTYVDYWLTKPRPTRTDPDKDRP